MTVSVDTYYAHSARASDGEWHRLSDHLEATGQMAARFLAGVGWQDVGQAVGLLHDMGKYTVEFQDRLKGSRSQVNHSLAGAEIAWKHYGLHLGEKAIAKLMSFCVAGHHAGLANGTNGRVIKSLEDRLKGPFPHPDSRWKREVTLPPVARPHCFELPDSTLGFTLAFLCRMIFSALVDADYLDTEARYGKKGPSRGDHPSMMELASRFDRYLDHKMAATPATDLNAIRASILSHVLGKADADPGVFTLTVPTGVGRL